MRLDKQIQVCSNCFKASCWYGVDICPKALDAGIAVVPVSFLKKLNREDDTFWCDDVTEKFYGTWRNFIQRGAS